MWEEICIILYILALLIVFISQYRKRRFFDVGCFLLSLYIVCSVVSLFLFNSKPDNWSVSLFPFIFLFVLFYISLKPILQFNPGKIDKIYQPSMVILNAINIVYIICALLSIGSFSDIGIKIALLISDSSVGQEMYADMAMRADEAGSSISNLSSIIANMLYNFEVLVFFYLLLLNNRSRFQKIVIILLDVCLLVGLISSLLMGQRGGIVTRGLLIISTYFLMKPFFSDKLNKLVIRIGIVIVIIVTIPFMALTFSRFGESSGGGMDSIYEYAGQNILNFNEYSLDNNGIRYGDRTFPLFKKMLLFDNVPDNYIMRRYKYPNLKINDEVFVTYIGDFILDFGPVLAFILLSLFSVFILNKTRIISPIYPFHKLILLHFLISIIAQGVFLYEYADTGNLVIMMYFLLYILFLFRFSLNRRNLVINRM